MSQHRDLVHVLKLELQLHSDLLSILEEEKAGIVRVDTEAVQKSGQKKEELLLKAKTLEERRSGLMDGKLSELIEKCTDDNVAAELSQIRDQLLQVGTKVQEQNNYNGKLIKESLGLVSTTLAIFRSTPPDDLPTYGRSGKVKEEPGSRKSLIDKA